MVRVRDVAHTSLKRVVIERAFGHCLRAKYATMLCALALCPPSERPERPSRPVLVGAADQRDPEE